MTEPAPAGPFGRRPLPRCTDWRRALDVYVAGRSRGLTSEEKRGLADSTLSPSPPPAHVPGSAGPVAAAVDEPRFGVPIPDVPTYHRSASTWRDRLFEGSSRNVARD